MSFWSKAKGLFGRIGRGIKNIAGKYGTAIGAGIGSLVPGVGTALGTTIGAATQKLANLNRD